MVADFRNFLGSGLHLFSGLGTPGPDGGSNSRCIHSLLSLKYEMFCKYQATLAHLHDIKIQHNWASGNRKFQNQNVKKQFYEDTAAWEMFFCAFCEVRKDIMGYSSRWEYNPG
jgi:hypothetical protein